MAVNAVSICNMALNMLAQTSTIETLTERSKEARTLSLWYDPARRYVLQMHDWAFARKRQTLALHSEDPPDGVWVYRYQTPSDMLQPRRLEIGSIADFPKQPYEVEVATDGSMSLLTNLQDAVLVYTFDRVQPDFFPPAFVLLHARALAAYSALAITGNATVERNQLALLGTQIERSTTLDAKQGVMQAPPDSDMITGR